MRCPKCGDRLKVTEDTQMIYLVSKEDGTLYVGEVSDEFGGAAVKCRNVDCLAEFPDAEIDWDIDFGIIGAKVVELGEPL